jgi:hypothetical protein
MNIYPFFQSPDVAEYCEKIGHTFDAAEMALIVAVSHKPLFAEHAAWREIMAAYPDMPVAGEGEVIPSLQAYLRERIAWEEELVNAFYSVQDGFVYRPHCWLAFDGRGENNLMYNGYSLEACPTAEKALEALAQERAAKKLRQASVKKEWHDEKWDIWRALIEIGVDENGELATFPFHVHDSYQPTINNRHALEHYLRKKVLSRIPVPFAKGDIVDMYDFNEPYVLAELPTEADRVQLYSIARLANTLEYEESITELYYVRYYREKLRGQDRYLEYLSQHFKTGKYGLAELVNLFYLVQEMPQEDIFSTIKKPRPQKELMGLPLPKYGKMLVTGTPVTPEQALEIIFRTDYVHQFGEYGDERFPIGEAKQHLVVEAWHARMDWFNSYSGGGGWGWLRPDGQISYGGNFSRMAEVEEIYADWKLVAKAFPFLEVNITLFNDEAGTEAKPFWRNSYWLGEYESLEFRPMVSMQIKAGKIKLVDPLFTDVHKNDQPPTEAYVIPAELADAKDPRAISRDRLLEWFARQ